MKKLLITGSNSYIGTSLEKWLRRYPGFYSIDTLDMRNRSWKNKDFSEYDVVFHVAGIAHIKETKQNEDIYYQVNRDLAYETAEKSKKAGVSQFVFLSSMSVYGIDSGVIDENSLLSPRNNYGKSKLQAEELISTLEDGTFRVTIIRPPMVYGKGCKGNYPRLVRLVLAIPCFPAVKNRRSMIYIENLCEFVRLVIDDSVNGVFCPQNDEYICTSDMAKQIAEVHGKRLLTINIFKSLVKLVNTGTFNKLFGDLVYSKNLSKYSRRYCVYNFSESIAMTESGE